LRNHEPIRRIELREKVRDLQKSREGLPDDVKMKMRSRRDVYQG
jgi:hypothetical protein